MSDANKVRYGWPVIAVAMAAIALVLAFYEGGGLLIPALIPAGLLGYALGRRASLKVALAGFQDPGSTGVAVAIGLVLASLVATRLVPAGSVGAIVLPAILFLGAGYLLALARRRDVVNSLER